MTERPTFSPFWHRVRLMKPRLRPHVSISRQRYRGRIWHVVHDPTSNQFFRLNPIAHDFVGLLDGRRDVESAWKISLSKFGDAAPTQNEIIQLISQLHNSNLLSVDTTPETEQLLSRGRERLKKKIQQQAIGIMYFKIRVFNPDRIISFLEPIFRPILNVWGFLVWAAFLAFGLSRVLPHWDQLTSAFDHTIAPANWPWLFIVFIITKAIHETGHGVICKRFGGQVPEFGVMMLVMFPAPYVDASACWAFPSRWRRMAVGAGGMIFELFIATCAGFVWLNTDGGLIHQIAYNAMFTASISTVLFNANPLMRFDGYYILADWLEVPNLAQRSNKMLLHLIQKYIYRIENLTAPSSARGEQAILIIYGLAALAYRLFLFVSITLFVMGKMFGIGLMLAIWTASAWFILPAGTFVHWLASDSKLGEHRLRHVITSVVMIGAGVLLIGVVPMPDHRRAVGVVESTNRSGVYFGSPGFVDDVLVRPGDTVRTGQVLARLSNPQLEQERRVTQIQIEDFRAQEQKAISEHKPAVAAIAEQNLKVKQSRLDKVNDLLSKLVVRAPHGGVVAGDDPQQLQGAYVNIGDPMCEVVDTGAIRVTAVLSQREAWIYSLRPEKYTVTLRPMSDIDRFIPGKNIRVLKAGQRRLPHASLGYAGGGQIPTDPKDKSGTTAKDTEIIAYVTPDIPKGGAPLALVDQRVRLRFTLPSKPLAVQWLDRLSKLVQGRVKL